MLTSSATVCLFASGFQCFQHCISPSLSPNVCALHAMHISYNFHDVFRFVKPNVDNILSTKALDVLCVFPHIRILWHCTIIHIFSMCINHTFYSIVKMFTGKNAVNLNWAAAAHFRQLTNHFAMQWPIKTTTFISTNKSHSWRTMTNAHLYLYIVYICIAHSRTLYRIYLMQHCS